MTRLPAILLFLLLLAAGFAGWWLWEAGQKPSYPVAGPPAAPVDGVPPAQPALPAASGPAYPLAPSPETKPLERSEVAPAVDAFVGRAAATVFLHVDDLPRRVAATVDNLGREHAPPALWPVHPTGERFRAVRQDGAEAIAAENAARYRGFVEFVESLDLARTVDLYLQLYPLLQESYRELGYPKGHFNDRLVEVIDQLLAAPEPQPPVALELTEVKGPVPSVRPWVRYRFADPQLQSLTAGQKMMVRMGLENERRLKEKLRALRAEIVRRGQAR